MTKTPWHLLMSLVQRQVRSLSVDAAGHVTSTFTPDAAPLRAAVQPLPGGRWRVYLPPDAALALGDRLTWAQADGTTAAITVEELADVAEGRLRRAMGPREDAEG